MFCELWWRPLRAISVRVHCAHRVGKASGAVITCENTPGWPVTDRKNLLWNIEKYSWITVFFPCSSFFWPRHPSVCMGFFQKFSSKFHNRVVLSPLAFTPHHFIVNFFSASTLKNSLKKRNAILFHLIVLLSGRSGERWGRAVGELGARGR